MEALTIASHLARRNGIIAPPLATPETFYTQDRRASRNLVPLVLPFAIVGAWTGLLSLVM